MKIKLHTIGSGLLLLMLATFQLQAQSVESMPLETIWNYAVSMHSMRRYPEARHYYFEYLRATRDNLVQQATVATCLGNLMMDMKQTQTAERYYLRAYNLFKQVDESKYDKAHHDVALSVHNLGRMCVETKQYKRAVNYLRQAQRMREKLYAAAPAENCFELAETMKIMAQLQMELKKNKEAEKYYIESVKYYQEADVTLFDARMGYADALNDLASLYQNQNDLVRAELYYLRSVDIYQVLYVPARRDWVKPAYVATLKNLYNIYLQQQKSEEAQLCLNKLRRLTN